MIKFFRKIRYDLMVKNKTGKYFKYAIGEIILVVIGILIALQINNWNENRLKNQAIKTSLNSLIHDLNTEQNMLGGINNMHTFKFFSMQYLLKMEGSSPYDAIADRKGDIPPFKTNFFWDKEIPEYYDKEFIDVTFSVMHRAVVYPFSKSTLSELKSIGLYSKINPNLKQKIDSYYVQMENNFNGKPQSLAVDFQVSLAEDGFITTDTNKLADPISLLKNNPKRVGLVKRMIRESGWTVQSTIDLKARNEELIKLIEKEIASL